MHQNTDMVSAATFQWLMKIIKLSNSLQSSHWKIKRRAFEVYLLSMVGRNSSRVINQGVQTFDE